MKKTSIVSILILFGLLFVLSGCVEPPEEVKELGNDGVVISFDIGMPPTAIDEKEPFDIGVLIENKGTAKIEKAGDAAVFIAGIVHDSYDGIQSTKKSEKDTYYKKANSMPLEGIYIADEDIIPGDSDVVQWTNLIYKPDVTSGKSTAKITAQSCYKYSTISRAPICLATRSAIRDTTGTAICEIDNDEKPVTNDAAPIKVSKVTEYTHGSAGFSVVIEVKNVGNGAVYDKEYGTDCLGLHRQYQDKIYIDYVKLGDIPLECSLIEQGDENYIKLQDGGLKTFKCWKSDIAGAGISQEDMSIKLSYVYSETVQASMDINAV